ncbi:MAG: metallophosphoesterase [Ruminococcus sp.]|nr:metallophosphoesterase [Ruminococcus sp.]
MKLKTKIALSVISLLIVFVVAELIYSNNFLTIGNYEIKTQKTSASFRAVLLSDLHNKEFGANNEKLLCLVKKQNPDVIFTVGDFVTKFESDREVACKLLRELTEIAPVYSSLGNHERSYYDYDGLIEDIKATGVTLLDNELTEVELGGDTIVVGGLTDFPYYEYEAPDYNNERRYFLDEFIEREKDRFSILLAHEPEFFMWGLDEKELDLMLSGHTHGGVVRLPFIGGLLAPNQGFPVGQGNILPKYTKGIYESDTATMLITAGLSSEVVLPRFNNPPEVCVIDVNPD